MHIFSRLLSIDHKEIQSASETFGMSRAESMMRMLEKQDVNHVRSVHKRIRDISVERVERMRNGGVC